MLINKESYDALMEQQKREIKNMKTIKNNTSNLVIRILEEMQLNYTNQHPKEIPDMSLIVSLIENEVK